MDDLDRKLLNMLQTDFPIVPEPFAELAKRLGMTEEEVIRRVNSLKDTGIIRQISAIFDSRALGYASMLVAFSVTDDWIEQTAETVSAYPGVSHNYERNHYYNLWFTITVPPGTSPASEVGRLAAQTGPQAVRMFPALRVFKIGVAFDMTGDQIKTPCSPPCQGGQVTSPLLEKEGLGEVLKYDLNEEDIEAVRALQRDLSLERRPFAALAVQARLSEDELIARANSFLKTGIMRRYAAVLHHRKAGFSANAMVAWKVPEDAIEAVGLKMADHPSVSHCYRRPTFPDWPYSIFTMIHGHAREDCEKVAREISESTGMGEYVLLFSTREFKKSRVRYFEQ